MRIALLVLPLVVAAPAFARDEIIRPLDGATAQQAAARPACATQTSRVRTAGRTGRVRPLDREPAANLYLGVLRYEGGCEKPVIVRENVTGR